MGMMELYIETLTGTAFELRVSPFETIMSVKAKIQRLEGIPISQQHLIWQSMELEDDYCLHDYSIHDGATLKLVLAMRGGPINTRRIPMEDPAMREMAEYMEANRDEIWEKLPGNKQVTLLVFREGDQLNFFRVVDRGDGTLTPLSESLSGASVYNLYDEEDDDELPTKEKVEENDKTKEKMKVLRMKMENLTLNKKPKKKHLPRPPSTSRPGSKSHRRRRASAGKAKGQTLSSLNKNTCLPPVGQTLASTGLATPQFDLCASGGESSLGGLAATSGVDTAVLGATSLPSSTARKTLESIESAKLKRSLSSVREDFSTAQESTPAVGAEASFIHRRDPSEDPLLKDSIRTPASPRKKDLTLEALKESLRPPPSSKGAKKDHSYEALGRPTTSSRKEGKLETLKETLPPASSKYANMERKREITLESLSQSEARAMSGLLRQASIEKLGSSKISSFVQSASKSRTSFTISSAGLSKDGRIPTPEGRLVSARLQKLSASRDGRVVSPSHHLPPVKQKKKATKRCFMPLCGKKTGLANSYTCRCGHNFCATHRYAESHDCTFDYKTEGRKLLEQSNPVVSAPKLPKI